MKFHLFAPMAWGLFAGSAAAFDFPSISPRARHPICEQDLSQVPLPPMRGVLVPPEGLTERGLRPSLLHIQQEVCRCLPRRSQKQPAEVLAQLHIQPNAGKVTIEYRIEPPWNRAQERMMACLGEPTLTVAPMHYVSDMITAEGRVEEVVGYPIKLALGQAPVQPGWLGRTQPRSDHD